MKRITIGVILSLILILLLSSLSFTTIGNEEVTSTIIYVDDDGTADYTNIQDAIDNASDGDTIFVYNGTYYGNLDIDESIKLIGESYKNTIIKTDGNIDDVLKSYINVTGGIFIDSNVLIKGFRFDDFFIEASNDNIIDGNILNSSCMFFWASNNQITNNIIVNNTDFGGLGGIGPGCNISGNLFDNNKYGVILVEGQHIVSKNVFSNNEYGLVLYPFTSLYATSTSGNVTVTLNTFTNNSCGLFLFRYLVYLKCWSHITQNNFIKNDIHARFLVSILPRFGPPPLRPPYPIIKFEKMNNRWMNNYWDDYLGIGPKMIPGKIGILCLPEDADFPPVIDDIQSPIFTAYWGGCPFINFDWHPAKEPYDIPIGGK